ncbi:Response regulator of zinc sigma-54-dependent two-component system [Sandaracinus amylolyticus]|nr:Response regulator of zinc sigma-54-dependent two-component system [Sandaracinus amylolyticus]
MAAGPLLGGRYRHVRELGRGAIGRVVEVEDTIAGGARAAKIVSAAHGERLQWELALLTSISHPGLAAVHELLRVEGALGEPFALEAGAWVLVEELAEGRVSSEVARGLAGLGARVRFATIAGAAIARSLAALHAAGLVHGDVKPANVVVAGDPAGARLIDLGLAGAPGLGPVMGTPGFLAPEAWLGARSPASDLFALGVTLARWIAGDDEDAGTGARSSEPLRGVHRVRAPALPADVPPSLRTLIDELLRDAPEERPASAREVARRLDPDAAASTLLDEASHEERARRASVAPLQGRSRELSALRAAIDAPGVVAVVGPPGSGRTRLAREAVRALQADRARDGAEVPTWIDGALPARVGHACVVHDGSGALSIERARAAVRAAELEGASLVVILERAEVIEAPGMKRVTLGPIDDASLGALLTDVLAIRGASAALQSASRAASSGLPGRLCRIVASAFAQGRDPSRPDVMRSLGRDEGAALAVPEIARPLAEALAMAGGTLRADEARIALGSDPARAGALLAASGLATFDATGLVLRADRVRSITRELGAARRKAIARSLDRAAVSGLARACVDAALDRRDAAHDAFLALAAEARATGDPLAAADVLATARERLASTSEPIAIALADALRAAGEENAAHDALSDVDTRDARALAAELARLRGDLATAEREALALVSETDVAGLAARCTAARIAWGRGELERASVLARSVRDVAGDRIAPLARALEVETLVAMSRGERVVASSLAAELERVAARAPRDIALAARARAASLAGSAALASGTIELAIEAYERAAELAERAGERHGAASATVNLGLARLDAGRLGPAIEALREGARRLATLRRPHELGRALFNLANAAFLAGDDALAQLAAERARDAARESGDRDASDHATIVLADLELRAGRVRGAIRALEGIEASGAMRGLVDARLAIAHAALGEIERARERARSARASAPEGSLVEVEVLLAEARVALAAGESPIAEARAMDASAAARTFETRVRAALVGAEAAELEGRRSEAAARLGTARALLDRAAAGLSPEARARLRAVPSYQRALATAPQTATSVPTRDARAVITLARRVAAERRPARVLETLAGAALELAGAERAFVLGRRESGTTTVRCAVGLTGALGPEHRASRSIAARVIDERRPMVSVDAQGDARWDGAASVHAMALRSVLAVPLPAPDGSTLALCLDDRLRPGAFDEGTVADVAALAELGAAALAAAERTHEARRDARIWARRARTLEQTLEARGEELRTFRDADRGEGPFAAIVAVSEPMRRVIALASRVAASGVPVLLVGESGTGKELLARAIHAASARVDAAFVGESCAAIPETLLESTLFGHVRGAFTGADRARRGLFEIAHEGTLFLDEIAETSPAMQAKLLRVLQEGEIRSVGSERVRRVDVRLVAACRSDLASLAREGRFREDLYYRIAVVTIEVPPLRERPADVAPLAAALLARHAPSRRVRIDDDALTAMRGYAWPGNVRELENELRRALLVAGERIGVEHLSPALRGDDALQGELDLKAQTEALERRLVERALEVHGGNQTRAAKALGLSRFGLQKMMKRLALDHSK